MDGKTRELLEKINRIATRAEGRHLLKKIDLFPEMREHLKRIVDDWRLPEISRKRAKEMLNDPSCYREMEKVDEDAARRMEASVERDIKRAIKQGYLDDPSASVEEFMKDKK